MSNPARRRGIRAERRLGEMLKAQKKAGLMNNGGGDKKSADYHQSQGNTSDSAPTLADMGISKNQPCFDSVN